MVCALSRGVSLCSVCPSWHIRHLAVSPLGSHFTYRAKSHSRRLGRWLTDDVLGSPEPRQIRAGVATSLGSQCTRSQRWRIPKARWLTRLARAESSSFKWETLPRNIRRRVTEKDICTYVHVYMWTYRHTCTHTTYICKKNPCCIWGLRCYLASGIPWGPRRHPEERAVLKLACTFSWRVSSHLVNVTTWVYFRLFEQANKQMTHNPE